METPLAEAAEALRNAKWVCMVTGAGVSAESGVPTFRDPGGVWQKIDPRLVATPEGFARDPRRAWEFYNARRMNLRNIAPNPGHFAMAELETLVPAFGLITQNVDRLHHRAGSKNVVEIHGNIGEIRCITCDFQTDKTGEDLPPEPRCALCGDWLRPNVVWFGEILPADAVRTAQQWIADCDVFISAGTSGAVYPVADFAFQAAQLGATVIEINAEPTPLTRDADVALRGRTGEIFPRLVSALKNR
jgi:NAD-dependent deacetylase